MFKPEYLLTDKIVKLLTDISEARIIIQKARLLPKQELKLRRQALIRMTQSSTEIEGNILNLDQVEAILARKKIDAPERDIYEVQNYLKALKYIDDFAKKQRIIGVRTILAIHKLVTNKTLPKEQSGVFRNRQVYIVRRRIGQPDEIIYTGPKATQVKKLTDELIAWILEAIKIDINPIVIAGITHHQIAAIHPFADGNGRTARATATLILYTCGYDFKHLFALEDYYNRDRQIYYQAINIGKSFETRKTDTTPWLEYFVEGFKEEIDNVKSQVLALAVKNVDSRLESQILLTKNQLKIIDFLDQMGKISSSDVVDVLSCPKRTAQLYLQKLKKIKMIYQVGKGPKSAYKLTSNK